MFKMKQLLFTAGLIACAICSGTVGASEARLMRYPDIANDSLVFVYADRLWIADVHDGHAHALTESGFQPSYPKFSPDGSTIAYTAVVDGNADVYVVPIAGGTPKRLTNNPARDYVVDWYPSGQAILFASSRSSNRPVYNQLYRISVGGGLPERLPLPYGENAAFSQGGKQLLFTYKRDFQEEAWKRYYGGRAPDIWSYDLQSGATKQLTFHDASDSAPMVIGDQIFFLSERDDNGRDNIWRMDSGQPHAVTSFVDTDVRRPSTDGHRIIFEANGRLYLFDPASSKSQPLTIDVPDPADVGQLQEEKVGDRIRNAALGSNYKVAIEARGEVFIYDGRSRTAKDLTQSSAFAERYPSVSSKGDIAYFSDRDGEYSLYIQPKEAADSRKVATFGPGFRYRPFWSPDGHKIAFFDQTETIWLVDVATGKATRIDQGTMRLHDDLEKARISWSPDSNWMAYSRALDNRNQAIFIFDVKAAKRHQLTSGAFSDFAPVFDLTGNYLLALSYRNYQPTFGDLAIDATWTYAHSVRASIIPLTKAVRVPGKPEWKMPPVREYVAIDMDGFESRIAALDVAPGIFTAIAPTRNGFALLRDGTTDIDPAANNRLELYRFGKSGPAILQSEKKLELADWSDDALLTQSEAKLFVVEQKEGAKPRAVDGSKLVAMIDRKAEYQQMFNDAWRYPRDYFYDPGSHGVDWDKVGNYYRALVPYVRVDDDLTFIVREMVGELGAGHVYASATAPQPRGDASTVGLLGIDFAIKDGAYQIAKIYHAGSREYDHRSPLDDASLEVKEGMFLLSVNGKALDIGTNPWAAFEGLADKVVQLRIADDAAGANARTISVKAMGSERKLRELAWVEDNRRKVADASGGRIGYLYVPNTNGEGQTELMIQYRSQFNKDALLVDERFNTGGAFGDRLVELLNRPPLIRFRARNIDDYNLPELAHRGPTALLTNGWSYSGGDGFPLLFKTAGVGKLIGTRTWGGLIGPGLFLPLINGGFISAPPFRTYGTDGLWSEGNEGVEPTIELANDPGLLASGVDQQLDRGVEELMRELKDQQPVLVPAFPKTGDWNPAHRGEK